jgi:purine-cytosine permease-like protein
VTAIVTFATLIIVCTTPWVVIMTIGYIMRRGFYLPDDLQVFNRRQKGGAYWFTRGVNYRGMAAWIPAAVLGLLFVNIPGQFEGPLRDVAPDLGFERLAGVDISLLVAIILAAVLYTVFLWLSPEPRAVYGPDGPRFGRATDAQPPPIRPVGG